MTATLYAMDNSNSAGSTPGCKLLDCLEVTTSENPSYSVIWMHGLGADGHDFEPIVTVNGGAVMRAWYDIIELSTARGQDEAGIKHSAGKIRDLIDFEMERGIPASRIILAGFSQGGAMALHVGLRYPEKLAGIMALSAYLLFPERLRKECSEANSTTPVFLGHGTQDPVVPFALGQAVNSVLTDGQWPVEWHNYPIPHSVSPEEIADIGHWIRACLN